VAVLNLVERIGSYVGFAAFVGLAILSLLYFSQARDVRRLREWAGRAPERASEQLGATQHYLPPTPITETKQRKPLRERIRNVHVPQLRYTALAIGGVVILAGAVFGALQLVGNDNGGGTTSRTTVQQRHSQSSNSGSAAPRKVNVNPGQVTVAVLNGTTIAGLAAQGGEEARADGFTLGTVTNAAKTNQAHSQVLYRSGQKNAADAVANRLGIDSTGEVDPLSSELAGSFDVVVLVGADRSQ
jgi:hypothetical protein